MTENSVFNIETDRIIALCADAVVFFRRADDGTVLVGRIEWDVKPANVVMTPDMYTMILRDPGERESMANAFGRVADQLGYRSARGESERAQLVARVAEIESRCADLRAMLDTARECLALARSSHETVHG